MKSFVKILFCLFVWFVLITQFVLPSDVVESIAETFVSAPKCDAEETTNLVYQLADKSLYRNTPGTYALEAIRVRDKNPRTKAYTCAADLKVLGQNEYTIPIIYTVELGTKRGEFYVTLKPYSYER